MRRKRAQEQIARTLIQTWTKRTLWLVKIDSHYLPDFWEDLNLDAIATEWCT